MPTMDLAAASALLKEFYLGPLRNQLNVATPILSRLVKNTKDIEGKYAVIPLKMRLPQGVGARAELAILPGPRKSVYKEAKPELNHYYGSVELSGPSMRYSEKGKQASFIRLVDSEIQGLKETLMLTLGHDFYLGHRLATCAVNVATNTLTLNASTNMEYFYVDMIVDVVDAATGLVFAADSRTVTAVDKTLKTITVDGAAVTTAVTDIVVREDTYGVCVTSLDDIVDSTTDVFGITTSSFEAWKATEQSSPAVLALPDIQEFLDKVMVASGKVPTALIADLFLQSLYVNLLQANRQYVPVVPPKTLDGGFRALEYSYGAPIEWIADRLAPSNQLLAIHEPDLQVFSPGEWDFIEIAGDVWLPNVLGASGVDSYKATIYRDMELGAFARNSHGKWTGITS